MAKREGADETIKTMLGVRQARLFTDEPVTQEEIDTLLEVARWTGSGRNKQPWHFIVVTDKDMLRQISSTRPNNPWVADAPLAIVIVLNGDSAPQETYDEGRVTERLFIAARALGLSGGTAWWADSELAPAVRTALGIPDDKVSRSAVVLGHPITHKDHRPNANIPGRKPLEEIVSWGTYGTSERPS